MKKRAKRLIALIAASAMLLQSGVGAIPVRAASVNEVVAEQEEAALQEEIQSEEVSIEKVQTDAAQALAAELLEVNAAATARYNSIRISWEAAADHTYTIARSAEEEGTFETLSATEAGPEYVDANAGTDAKWFYKITDNTTGNETAVFSNEEATGFETLAKNAQFKWVNSDGIEFDGNTMLSFKDNDIAAVKDLEAGTIIYKGYQNTTTGTGNRVLLGLKNSTGSGYFGERSDKRNQVGIILSGLISGWNLAFSPSFVGSTTSEHAVGYVSPKAADDDLMLIAIDNTINSNAAWKSGKYGGFMQKPAITEITIGGFGTPEAVTDGWNGGIDYVLITSEILSQDEVKAITTAKPDLAGDTSDKLQVNAKATPGYSSVKITWDAAEGHTYTISRSDTANGEYTQLAADGTTPVYVDEVETGTTWYYKIADETGAETAAFKNKTATGLDALKENAQFKWLNDGNTTFNGSTMLSFSGDQIAAVKDLTSGTILCRGYLTGAPSGAAVMLGLKNSTTQGFLGTRSGKGGQWGWELGNLISGWNISLTNASLIGTAVSQHATGYVSPEGTTPMLLAFDGKTQTNNGWTGGTGTMQYGGFMQRAGITELTIGGFGTPTAATSGWNGGIDYVLITDEILTQDEINTITAAESATDAVESGRDIGEMFNNNYDNNSWVFTGGESVQGGFDQVGGARNYIGQFEEYVRWMKSVGPNGRQRYTINTAKKGQTLEQVITNWDNRVAEFDPKAVAYMVGSEDYSKGTAGVTAFKAQLKQFIDKATAMRGDKGFAVIQKPFATNDTAANTQIQAYSTAVDEVVAEYAGNEKLARIVVVDHFTQTNNNDFKTNKLNEDNTLNKWGHFEIGRQLCEATITITPGYKYPANICNMDQEPEQAAKTYSKSVPSVTAEANSLNVEIPAAETAGSWTYTLQIGETKIRDTAAGNNFAITELPAGENYTLTIRATDWSVQLQTVTGTITAGDKAVKKAQTLDANQQRLAEKMASKEPMTWLFMGDSITHAAMWTNGYDGIALSFEKFLKDDLGRGDDVVINTAVSGAMTNLTLDTIEQRLEKYSPDVVSIMLGTNDCTALSAADYKTKLKDIVTRAKAKGAIVILRTPTPGQRDGALPPFINAMKEVAAEDTELIYVDQFTEMKQVYTLYPHVHDDFYLDYSISSGGMDLHPGANGHLIMTRQFIEGCGLWTDDSKITNLFYKIPFAEEANTTTLPLTTAPGKIGLSVKDLAAATSRQIGGVTITAVDKTSGRSYEISTELGKEATLLTGLKNDGVYTVTVKAYLRDALKVLTFAPVEVDLSQATVNFSVSLSNLKQRDLKAGAKVGTFSVSSMAPEGTYNYELVAGDGSTGNASFAIKGNTLKVAKALTEGETYSIRVKAVNAENDTYAKEQVFEIAAVGSGLLLEKSDVTIKQGSTDPLNGEAHADEVKALEEGTVIVQYTSTGTYGIQSLFSVANGTAGNNDRHFHVYVTPDGTLGFEIRNTNAEFNIGGKTANAVRPTYKEEPAKNTIAFKADKEKGQYKLFANGKLVATVDKGAAYKFISDITNVSTVDLGGTIRGGNVAYTFGGTIHNVKVYSIPLTDEELIEATGVTSFDRDLDDIFNKDDATGSNYFRIPALLTLKDGTVVSAIDARFGGTHDSPNNIDIAFSKSTDGGKTWSEATMPLHFDDFADDRMTIPVGKNVRVNGSASFIDPQLLQDEETGRLFLIADAMPSGVGSPNAETGNGYKTVGDKKYLKLKKAGETAFDYSIHEDNFIYNDTTGEKTAYSVNGKFELLKDGVALTVKQKSASYDPTGVGEILTSNTNNDVAMNIMYDTADFQAQRTTYLYMVYSDNNGETWSDPINLNGQVKADSDKILITGPGRGIQIKNGDHAGRLIIPVYKNVGCDIIYSDDHGASWTFTEGPALADGVAMSESQIVEMPDGSLKVFARSNSSKIAMATSLDGGNTWSIGQHTELKQPGWGSQISVINYSGLIDGKSAIILSSPEGVGSYRRDGRVKIGLITDTGAEGVDKYSIDWAYDYQIDDTSVPFGYSCLTELPNHNIGILYEKYDSYNPAELHTMDAVKYEELDFTVLREKDSVEVIPVAGENGTVSQRNIVDKGSEVTITAAADEGFEFVNWTDAEGNVVSTSAEYTFRIDENQTLTANFRAVASEEVITVTVEGTAYTGSSLQNVIDQAIAAGTVASYAEAKRLINISGIITEQDLRFIKENIPDVLRIASKSGDELVYHDADGNVSTKIPNEAFKGLQKLQSFEIKTVTFTEIGDYAFAETPALSSSVSISGLKRIGEGAFKTSKTSGKIPKMQKLNLYGVTYVGADAFMGRTDLQTVSFDSVEEIGANAFRNLPNLKSFSFNTFPDYPKLQKIGANAFSVDEGLTTVPFTLYLPNNADYTVDMVIPELVLDEDGNHPFTNRALNGQLGAYTSKVEGFLRASDYYNEEANTWCDFPLKAVTVAAEFHAEGEPIIVNVVKGESFGESFPAAPTRTDYVFTGWNTAEDGSGDAVTADTVVTRDTFTAYAQWKEDRNNNGVADETEDKYTVTYTDGVADAEIFADQTTGNLLSGDATPAFDGTPTRTGYVFGGWTPAAAETVTADATYTATWKADRNNNGVADETEDKYTVTYTDGVKDEEVFKDQVTENLLSGDATPAFQGAPTREGYVFEGWTPAVAETVTADATYTATWKKIPTETVSISGKVTDEAGKALAGVTVIVKKAGTEVARVTTGADGSYSVPGLEAGAYTLSYQKDGYETEEKVILAEGTNHGVEDIALEKKPVTPPTTGGDDNDSSDGGSDSSDNGSSGSSSSGSNTSGVPGAATGDTSAMGFYLTTLLLAAGCLAVLYRRRRQF